MGFNYIEGKKILLRVMSRGVPRRVSSKRMERISRYGGVSYAIECVITMRRDLDSLQNSHKEIEDLLSQHEEVFHLMPLGRPPDRGFEHTIEMDISAD
jgi:hypothetical protein